MTGDARLVSALKLISSTRDILTVGHRLVITAGAILLAIADPTPVNTRDPIFAQVLSLHARHWSLPVAVVDGCTILK